MINHIIMNIFFTPPHCVFRQNFFLLVQFPFTPESEIPEEILLKMLDLFVAFVFIIIAFSVIVSIFVFVIFFKDLKNLKNLKENRKFIREIVVAQEKEWKRISMEVHDNVIQNMKAVGFMAKEIVLKTDDEKAKAKANEIIELEKQSQKNLRVIIQNLYPIDAENASLKTLLADLCEKFSSHTQTECKFYFSPEISNEDMKDFSNEEKYHITRIVQEAFLNAQKYSQATEVELSVLKVQKEEKKDEQILRFMVFDNGKGFDFNGNAKSANIFSDADGNHFGLSGMEMRAKLLGGKLFIKSFKDIGTEICLEINN